MNLGKFRELTKELPNNTHIALYVEEIQSALVIEKLDCLVFKHSESLLSINLNREK